MADEVKKPTYRDTLNLPRTDFPIRSQAKIDDPALIERWQADGLYAAAAHLHRGEQTYILHDGPPYANGHIHLGHAYNKILKDILTKSYRMAGYHVPVKPGWDCHGLPIEFKVAQEHPGLSSLDMKRECRAYAQEWMDVQREEFKRLGVVMEWDSPYATMEPTYEAKIIEAFGIFLKKGFIERKNKTIPWCGSCKTTLATAEIEYKDRKDPSIYVRFPLTEKSVASLFPEAEGQEVSFLVWTTTPWTLPLNRAVALKQGAQYVLVRMKDQLLVMGAQAAQRIADLVGEPVELLRTLSADMLSDARIQHPFNPALTVPVIYEDFVSLTEGTACVHVAPGCGPIDYEAGIKNRLEIYSPVSAAGTYSADIVPQELSGMPVVDGQIWVIKKLYEMGKLFFKTSLTHSYPHCWRCRNGLIFRATKQWFINLAHDQIKETALAAVEKIDFVPAQGKSFLRATIDSRWEWCLSRQRAWGVPIPAVICETCDYVVCTQEFIDNVARKVAQEGVEYWDRVTIEELFGDSFACPACASKTWVKERDILDVWFESGISHYAVLYHNPDLAFPADVYLEGIDQNRGWFQSSLLTALVLEGEAPMKSIVVHGFTVDEKGQKMSKSLGNVIAPSAIIEQYGTDVLRLWAASTSHEGDAVVSETLLRNVAEVFRKVRNTCRFLISNLYDFKHTQDAVSLDNLFVIDRAILARLEKFNSDMIAHYHASDTTAVFHGLADFCAVDLSAWYLDIVKDRLYVEKADGHARRSAQTTCWYLLDTLTRLIAPIMSFTAEQLRDLYQHDTPPISIHLQTFADLAFIADRAGQPGYRTDEWDLMRELRSAVLKAIEGEREKGVIKHSLEAAVILHIDSRMKNYELYRRFVRSLQGQTLNSFFKEFFIVSQVIVAPSDASLVPTAREGLSVRIEVARGAKCPRCWNYDEEIEEGLCRRCQQIVM